jgi:hypothetical protein
VASDERRQPLVGSALVVLHHLGGFRSWRGPGLLHPGTGQDSLSFGPARPESEDPARRGTFPSAHSHPTKTCSSLAAVPHHYGRCPLGVRWTMAPFADLAVVVDLRRPGPSCASWVRRPRARNPSVRPHPSEEVRVDPGPPSVWIRHREGAASSPDAPFSSSASTRLRICRRRPWSVPRAGRRSAAPHCLSFVGRPGGVVRRSPRLWVPWVPPCRRARRGCPRRPV